MAGSFNILLGSKLDNSPQTVSELNKQINTLSSQLTKLNLKINIDSTLFANLTQEFKKLSSSLNLNMSTGELSSKLDKLVHSYKYLEDGSAQLNKITTETTNKYGEQIKLVEKLNQTNGQIEKSELTIANNLKQRRKEQEAINKLQSEHISKQVKETVQNMTSTPDGVKQLNQYYKELEKSLGTVEQAQKKVNKSQSEYWAGVRQEKVNSMTTKSKELQDMAKYYSILERSSASANAELTKLKQNAETTNNVIRNFGTASHHQKADELTNSLRTLNLTQNMTQEEMQETVVRARQMSNELSNVSREAKATGNNSMTLGSMLSTAFQKFGVWMGITSIFYSSIRAIRSSIKEVIELDTAMTELNKVLDVSQKELEDYTAQAYKMGEVLGRTGKDVLNATAEFARAGYSLSESAELANQALLLTNVADGLEDTSEAAGYLIAVLKGYQKEASETAHVVDTLNEVSNNFAVNTVDLAEGLQRTSGTLSQTGTSMEELAGILTGSYEVLRNMEKSSSGLITISSRLRGVSESGEEIDGLMPKLQKAFKEYAGIDIQTQNGQLRSTYDILSDLSKVWSTLSDEQRQYIGELASAQRQSPVLNAIMLNWENVEKATSTAMNSMGSALNENEKYMQSLEGRINLMKSAFSELAYNTIQSGTIGAFINLATYLAKATNSFGGLNTILVTATILLTALNKTFKAFLANRLEPIIASWATSFMKLEGNVTATAISIKGLTISTQALTAATTIGVSLAIAGLFKLISTFKQAEESQRKLVEETADNIKSTEQEITQLESLRDRYGKLIKEKERGINVDEELLQVQKQLANISDSLITGLDDEGNYISDNIELTNRLIERKKELLAQEQEAIQYEAQKKLPQLRQQITNAQAELDEINNRIKSGGQKEFSRGGQTYTVDITDDLNKQKLQLVNTLKELEEENTKWLSIVQKGITQEELSAVATAKNDDAKQSAIKSLEKYGLTVEEINEFVDLYIKKQNESKDATKGVGDQQEDHTKLLEKAQKSYEDITDKLITYNKILQEMNSKEGLQGSTKDEIIRKHAELAPYLDNEKQLRQELIRIIDEEEDAQRKAYQEMITYSETFFNAKLKGNAELVERLGKYYSTDLENAKSLAHAKEMVENKLISKLSENWAKYYKALIAGDKHTINGLSRAAVSGSKEAAALLSMYQDVEDRFNSVTTEFSSGVDFKGINLGDIKNTKKEKEEYSALADATLKYRNAIEEVNNQLSILKSQQNLETDDVNKITLLQKQNELLRQQQVNYHNLANAHRAERDALAQSLAKQGFKFDGTGDNKIITNLENIKGKSKEVEEQFKKFIDLQTKEIPSAQQQWWGLQNTIADVKTEMEKLEVDNLFKTSTKGIESLNKEFELLDFRLKLLDENETGQKFDLMSDKIQKAEFQVRFLADELQRLKTIGFEGSIEAVEEYNKQLDDLEKKHMDAQVFLKSLMDSQADDYKKVMNERERIADQTINTIKNAYRQQRELVINSLKQELRAEEDAHKRRIDNLNERLSKYEEIIKAQLESIDRQEDEDQFDKELTKAQEERSEIVRQINILSMDDSLEARAKVSDLNKQLTDQDERIEEMKHNRTITLRKQNLNDQLNAYKKDIDEKKSAEDEKFERTKSRVEREIEMEEWFYDKKINDEQYYADLREEIIDGNLNNVQKSLQGFLDEFDNYNKRTVQSINSSWQTLLNTIREIENAQNEIEGMPDKPSKSYSSSSSGNKTSSGGLNLGKGSGTPEDWKNNADKLKNEAGFLESELRRAQEVIKDRKSIGLDTSLQEKYLKDLITGSYAEGGKVDYTGLAMVHGSKNKPEYVFNYDQFKDLAKLVANYQHKPVTPRIPEISRGIELKIDNLINIEGNATKDILPALRDAGKNVLGDLQKQLNKNGVLRGVTG